jgi:predicted RNA-binding Zn-ribbon protein involved in translation (DUF1610 family)
MEASEGVVRPLSVLETVCCLECGEAYMRRAGGADTVLSNPGCPECGYLGWIPVTVPAERERPRRFAAGQQPLRPLRSH